MFFSLACVGIIYASSWPKRVSIIIPGKTGMKLFDPQTKKTIINITTLTIYPHINHH